MVEQIASRRGQAGGADDQRIGADLPLTDLRRLDALEIDVVAFMAAAKKPPPETVH